MLVQTNSTLPNCQNGIPRQCEAYNILAHNSIRQSALHQAHLETIAIKQNMNGHAPALTYTPALALHMQCAVPVKHLVHSGSLKAFPATTDHNLSTQTGISWPHAMWLLPCLSFHAQSTHCQPGASDSRSMCILGTQPIKAQQHKSIEVVPLKDCNKPASCTMGSQALLTVR